MKVDYEIRQCDCCHDYYKPYGGKFAEYELTKNGEPIDLCNNCKCNLIDYINNNIKDYKAVEE